jgi:hypothetical protein
LHLELLATARRLSARKPSKSLTSTDLRRAVSTAYYALFHFVCHSCVEIFLPASQRPLSRARQQAYRSLDHRDVKNACILAKDQKHGYPLLLQKFAEVFLELNKYRERADYDPSPRGEFQLRQVFALIGECEAAISNFNAADIDDRRAFAVQVCLKSKARA